MDYARPNLEVVLVGGVHEVEALLTRDHAIDVVLPRRIRFALLRPALSDEGPALQELCARIDAWRWKMWGMAEMDSRMSCIFRSAQSVQNDCFFHL